MSSLWKNWNKGLGSYGLFGEGWNNLMRRPHPGLPDFGVDQGTLDALDRALSGTESELSPSGPIAQASLGALNERMAGARGNLASQEAAFGRLGSPVSQYPLARLEGQGQVVAGNILGGLAAQRAALARQRAALKSQLVLNPFEMRQQAQLAQYLQQLTRPSVLEQALSAGGNAALIASLFTPAG